MVIEIFLTHKKAYGKHYYYPSCNNSKVILSRNKTHWKSFTQNDVNAFLEAGWKVNIKEAE